MKIPFTVSRTLNNLFGCAPEGLKRTKMRLIPVVGNTMGDIGAEGAVRKKGFPVQFSSIFFIKSIKCEENSVEIIVKI